MEEKIARFLEFVKEKGGASVVAKKVNKHPQFIYNIEQGKGKPNFETLTTMKEAYPDLDLNWIFTGERMQVPADYKEMEYMKRENNILRALAEAKGVTLPKCEGVANSPKLYDVEGSWGLLSSSYFSPN